MKKVVIYARVSTEKQEREKTIESQLEDLRNVSKQNDGHIIKEYIDNGFSGGTLVRPALDKLRDDASRGLFEAVYIHSPDRLARKYVYQALVLEELKKKGIEVIFLNKPVTDNPEDQLLLGMQGLIAEYERTKIAERTRRGRFHKTRNGDIMGGTAPYGFDYVHKTLEKGAYYKINPEEAETVRLIFSLYLKYQSTARVTKELMEKDIRPRCGSQCWSKGMIHRMLRNECYIGTAYYNKRDKSGKQCKPRQRNEWMAIRIPPIIKDDTFQLSQELLKSHKGGKRIHTFTLSSLVKCKDCGSKYIGTGFGRKYHYYRCGNFLKRFPLPKNCDARPVRGDQLESAVLNAIQEAILKPHILVDHIMELSDKESNERELKRTKARLSKRKEKLETKRRRILNLYSEGYISKNEYIEIQAQIDSQQKETEKGIAEVDYKVSNKIDRSLVVKNINYLSSLAKERLESFSAEKTKEFLRYLIKEIIFDSHERTAHIIGFIPIREENSTSKNLFQVSPVWSGETWNKKFTFEIEVKL
jgi:site-specific DNA recombinase